MLLLAGLSFFIAFAGPFFLYLGVFWLVKKLFSLKVTGKDATCVLAVSVMRYLTHILVVIISDVVWMNTQIGCGGWFMCQLRTWSIELIISLVVFILFLSKTNPAVKNKTLFLRTFALIFVLANLILLKYSI